MNYSKDEATTAISKLMDLKRIFEFGNKMVPIIQNISNFLKEVIPLMNKINYSVAESASKMPVASDQIGNVTAATELATTEILDLVDKSSQSVAGIEDVLKEQKTNFTNMGDDFEKLREMLKDNKEASELLTSFEQRYNFETTVEKVTELIGDINDKNFKVTMSLQVQDITTQQLTAVRTVIDSVKEKLNELIETIDKTEVSRDFNLIVKESFDTALPESEEYNPNASYAKDDRQEKADKVIDEHINQADIDKLFG